MKYLIFGFWIIALAVSSCNNTQQSANEPSGETGANSEQPNDDSPIASEDGRKTIIFFGNSLSAGYGLEDPENQSFPGIIQQKLDSLSLAYRVVNAGLSGETTSGGKNRIDWILRQQVDVFVLELGGNDGLRGIQPAESKKNLQAIIDRVKEKYPEVQIVLAGMEAPPNMGEDFTGAFRSIYPELAEANQVALIPFLLQNVGGETELNQADGIHPNIHGHRLVAENVWSVLLPLLQGE